MASPIGERAISETLRVGNALLKFISPNDVGLTGGHQYGFYLPKEPWSIFSPHAPVKGRNDDSAVSVLWPDGRETNSTVKWYGRETRREYRLTGFGRDFPYRTFDNVGDLLVLVPESQARFLAFVLDQEDDIEELQAALGVQVVRSWAAFRNGIPEVPPEDEDECMERRFRGFVQTLADFPPGSMFSEQTWEALRSCVNDFEAMVSDECLLRCMEAEYRLFRMAERQICQPEIMRVFRDVDDFLGTASAIMNRRKARAGRSLENHVEYMLRRAEIPHVMRPDVDGKPDVLIPNEDAYRDKNYPLERLIVVGVKTTCKDRWRQVLNEALRIPRKHILTIQKGITGTQLTAMRDAGVTLVVPEAIRDEYYKKTPMPILSLEEFIGEVRTRLA